MTSANKIKSLLSTTPPSALMTGSDAKFLPIDDDWGFKFFRSERMRDANYDRQERFADIAPKLGDKIEFKLNNETVYGFVTERVAICGDEIDKQWIKENPEHLIADKSDWNLEVRENYYELMDYFLDNEPWFSATSKINEIIEEYEENKGIYLTDIHKWNWGITKDGRVVITDFSRFTDDNGFCYEDSNGDTQDW